MEYDCTICTTRHQDSLIEVDVLGLGVISCWILLVTSCSTRAHILHGIKHHMYSESVDSLSKSEIKIRRLCVSI